MSSTKKQRRLLKRSLPGVLKTNTDPTVVGLWCASLILVGFGVVMVLSASSVTSYLQDKGFLGTASRQASYALFGLVVMVVAAYIKPEVYRRFAPLLLVGALLFQLLVFTPLGEEVWGNRNWIRIAGLSLQPSEFLKLAMVLWVAFVISSRRHRMTNVKNEVFPMLIPGAAIILLSVILGQDLGTTIVMGFALLGCMWFGNISLKTIMLTVGAALLGVFVLVVTSENRMRRLFSLGSDSGDYSGLDWQPTHGLWALASGGLFGVGPGNSSAKWSWLPAAENDYIFAIIGEELGMIGASAVIIAYVALSFLMLRVLNRAKDRFSRVVVGGVLIWIVGQAFINIGVVLRILPVLGVPLPLISYGGTALVACMGAMGVVISIARNNTAAAAKVDSEAGGSGKQAAGRSAAEERDAGHAAGGEREAGHAGARSAADPVMIYTPGH